MILREVCILIFQSISGRKALYRTKLHFFGAHGARPHSLSQKPGRENCTVSRDGAQYGHARFCVPYYDCMWV